MLTIKGNTNSTCLRHSSNGVNGIEPVHDKTYNKTCVTSKNTEQPVQLPSTDLILVYPS